MTWCVRLLGIAILIVPVVGCHSMAMTKAETSGLGLHMSELQSALDNREITLDEYERAKQEVVLASPQRPATNAR